MEENLEAQKGPKLIVSVELIFSPYEYLLSGIKKKNNQKLQYFLYLLQNSSIFNFQGQLLLLGVFSYGDSVEPYIELIT